MGCLRRYYYISVLLRLHLGKIICLSIKGNLKNNSNNLPYAVLILPMDKWVFVGNCRQQNAEWRQKDS